MTTPPNSTYTLRLLVMHLVRLGWESQEAKYQEVIYWRHPQMPGEKITTPTGDDALDDEILAEYITAAVERLTILHRHRRLEDLQP